jgi:hypothetical protein
MYKERNNKKLLTNVRNKKYLGPQKMVSVVRAPIIKHPGLETVHLEPRLLLAQTGARGCLLFAGCWLLLYVACL